MGLLGAAGAAAGSDFELIGTVVLSANQANVNFTSIPQTYRHLQLRGVVKGSWSSDGDNIAFRLNGTNADITHGLSSSGARNNTLSSFSTGGSWVVFGTGNSSGAVNSFGAFIVDILDYGQTTKNKTIKALSGYETQDPGALRVGLTSSLRVSTAAVTSIQIASANSPNLVAGSRFSLYGMKG